MMRLKLSHTPPQSNTLYFQGLSRRRFLQLAGVSPIFLPTLLKAADEFVLAPGLVALKQEEEEQRQKLARQAENVLAPHDRRLDAHWPDNTVIYAATTQNWQAWPNLKTGVGDFIERLAAAAQEPKYLTLDAAIRSLRGGWCWKEVPFTPQVPVFSAQNSMANGWSKANNDIKERYVMLISGDGKRSSRDPYTEATEPERAALREELALWQKKNTEAAHTKDEAFIQYLTTEGKDKILKFYLDILEEESRFRSSLSHIRPILVNTFGVRDDKEHIKELHAPSPDKIAAIFKNWIGPKQDRKAELLVLYDGHGELEEDIDDKEPQGMAPGLLMVQHDNPMRESKLKTLFQQHVAGFSQASIILEACHSGAFIA